MDAYRALESRFKRIALVNEAVAMLHWDSNTMMPEGAAGSRAEQVAELKVMSHELLTAPETATLLHGARAERDLGEWQLANLREMRRQWLHAAAVPGDLVVAFSKACSECEMAWRKARPANDFASVRPRLERVLTLVREIAAAKGAKLGRAPYEALLDQYEPGIGIAEIDRLFDRLAKNLPGLIDGALAAQMRRKAPTMPPGPFPVAAQNRAGRMLMERLGFEFSHGRLDQSLHPFCGGTSDDVRITTRYDEKDFARALMGVLHETGHALYERGLPADWRHQPVGEARGMAVHESQSLLIEMQVCRSREFLEFAAPILRNCFGGGGPAWEAENLYRLGTRVERSLIRVDADEVTYPAHVILRYRLERALIAGEMEVADIPDAWQEGMRRLLGVVPPDDRLGCLQDVHWFDGAFGYFPTYTLGAMIAAQLYAAAKEQEPSIPQAIGRGDFAPLLGWLRGHVHQYGSLLWTSDLVHRATGKALDSGVFEAHLRERYLGA